MPVKDTGTFRVLGNAIQRTFGRQSEVRNPTHFLSMELPQEGYVKIKFMMIVNLGHEHNQIEFQKVKFLKEAIDYINVALKKVAEEYKEAIEEKADLLDPKVEPYEEAPKKSITLKFDENTISDSYEFVSTSLYTPMKRAYYRVQAFAKLVE